VPADFGYVLLDSHLRFHDICLSNDSHLLQDEDFFADYTEAHQKLFELG
jgi:hypothetical protein